MLSSNVEILDLKESLKLVLFINDLRDTDKSYRKISLYHSWDPDLELHTNVKSRQLCFIWVAITFGFPHIYDILP